MFNSFTVRKTAGSGDIKFNADLYQESRFRIGGGWTVLINEVERSGLKGLCYSCMSKRDCGSWNSVCHDRDVNLVHAERRSQTLLLVPVCRAGIRAEIPTLSI